MRVMSEAALQQPGKRQQQRADTHARIFEAAVAEFMRVGFGAAQIPQIAAVAGVARGTFYFHFPTKDHVLLELSERIQSESVAALKALRDTNGRLGDLMETLLDSVVRAQAALGESNLLREILALQVRLGSEAEPKDEQKDVRTELTYHLARAMKRGELRHDVDPERLATVVLTSLFGLLVAGPSAEVDRRVEFELLIEMLLQGMRVGAAHPS